MQYSSPNRFKIIQLSQKLKQLDIEDHMTSPSIQSKPLYPHIEHRIHNLTQKFKKTKSKDDFKYQPINNQLTLLQNTFKSQKRDFQIGINDREEVVKQIERSVVNVVEELSNDLRQERLSIVKGLQQKVKVIKSQYSQSTKLFKQSSIFRRDQIRQRIYDLKQTIDNERKSRDDTSQFLIKSFGEQILKLQQILNIEKTERIRGNRQALELIKEIQENLNSQIEEQKQIKNRNQGVFTRLLEETCFKIEQQFLN